MKTLQLPKKTVVDRARWLRGSYGSNDDPSMLFRSIDDRLCCLGFGSKQAGCAVEQLSGLLTPIDLQKWKSITIVGLVMGEKNSGLALMAMRINDDSKIDDTTRESKLTELFTKHGYEIEFIN